jgi:hypothetical protein
MTGGGWCMNASANFERLVLGCIKANFATNLSFSAFSGIYRIFTLLHRSKLKNSNFVNIPLDF